jgi:hypothetical protein
MNRSPNPLIEQMAAELTPVRSISRRDGLLLLCAATLLTIAAVESFAGLWRGAWTGQASAMFVVTNGLLLILGCASASSVLRMASPRVGNRHDGPKWAMAMTAVLPLAALAALAGHDHSLAQISDPYGLKCAGAVILTSVLFVATLVFWLRRGAPVSPSTAGLHVGVAASALGSGIYGLACPLDGVVHLGIWHVLPVGLGAVVGRLLLPAFLRW